MAYLDISPLLDSCWCYGMFPSTGQHVAKNSLGTFYLVATASRDFTDFSSTDFTLLRDDGSGNLSTVWVDTLPSNMACLETFESGELHVLCSDFVNGAIHDYYWDDVATSSLPVHSIPLTGAPARMAKIGTAVDDGRRALYVMGGSGCFVRLSATGALEAVQQVAAPGGVDYQHYWNLIVDDDGHLYVVVCSATGGTNYDATLAFMTPNPGAAAPAWYTHAWDPDHLIQLALPIDAGRNGPLLYLTTGEQEEYFSNLLISATVQDNYLHVAMLQARSHAHAFADDRLRDASVEIASVPFLGQSSIANLAARVARPARGRKIFPRCGSGALVKRGNRRFFIGADRDNLVALAQGNSGGWADFARAPVPMGSDFIHYVNAYRGHVADNEVVGAFQVIHCAPSQWSTGTAPVPPALAPGQPAASAYRFRLAL